MKIIKYITSKLFKNTRRKIKRKIKQAINPFYGQKGKRRKRILMNFAKRMALKCIGI